MKEVNEFLNKKEREIIENIEVYLELNGLNLENFSRFKGDLVANLVTYQYTYKRNDVVLVIEYIFNLWGFVGINFLYKVETLKNIKVFVDIEEFRDFIVEII